MMRPPILCLRHLHQKFISIINCYLPTFTEDMSELDVPFDRLEEAAQNENSFYKFVVKDFNAQLGKSEEDDYNDA
ncbi:hypothetical protein Y032_0171g316 [Ancylostoma ceylanicum]|uniref:Uncharacterized protein n=1 Tax=Ancylostoma ceylanicum TaxID=53326 RepID=A0A016SVP0_9BILA|nr:hypothetical protein Y032_0171g316 [Ancylostoma ceylanicum]